MAPSLARLGAANARGSGSSVMFMTWFFNARAIPWRIAYLFRLSESGVRIWGLMYLPPLILRKFLGANGVLFLRIFLIAQCLPNYALDWSALAPMSARSQIPRHGDR